MSQRFVAANTSSAGHDTPVIAQCRVVAVNAATWTVDVVSSFDRHYWNEVQVASPYMHYARGEGFFCIPEVGALCNVLLPSDDSPPFVHSFLAPPDFRRGLPGSAAEDKSNAYYDGGKAPGVPGDMGIRGRDGNRVILYRGGALEVGSTELCQRMYLPINHHMLDVAQLYEQITAGGAVRWGLELVDEPNDDTRTVKTSTYRIRAGDQTCDVRVSMGAFDSLGERDDLEDVRSYLSSLSADTATNPTIYEVVLAPGGFTQDGTPVSDGTRKASVLRSFYDKAGNVLLRTTGGIVVSAEKDIYLRSSSKVTVKARELDLQLSGSANLSADSAIRLDSPSVRLGTTGDRGIARIGDTVDVILLGPVMIAIAGAAPVPAVLSGGTMKGFISSASNESKSSLWPRPSPR